MPGPAARRHRPHCFGGGHGGPAAAAAKLMLRQRQENPTRRNENKRTIQDRPGSQFRLEKHGDNDDRFVENEQRLPADKSGVEPARDRPNRARRDYHSCLALPHVTATSWLQGLAAKRLEKRHQLATAGTVNITISMSISFRRPKRSPRRRQTGAAFGEATKLSTIARTSCSMTIGMIPGSGARKACSDEGVLVNSPNLFSPTTNAALISRPCHKAAGLRLGQEAEWPPRRGQTAWAQDRIA